jgi:hypothetical protein
MSLSRLVSVSTEVIKKCFLYYMAGLLFVYLPDVTICPLHTQTLKMKINSPLTNTQNH